MPFINSIINWLNIKRLSQIDLMIKYPVEVQKEALSKLLQTAQETEFGEKYRFDDIEATQQFQERVPITTYDDFKPWIERVMQGEKNIIWPGQTKWFAKSSGTTSEKSKFIPVTNESLEDNHYRGGRDSFVIYMSNFPESNIFKGKGLTLGGSHQINKWNNRSLYGDLSAILIDNAPIWTQMVKTPPGHIALMDKWEEKLDEITKTTIKENVTNLMGVPSWNLVLLKHILNHTGKSNILDIWPNLELFIHGGINFEPYREQFKKIITSDSMHYMETYNASEGFFAVQNDKSSNDMLLILDSGIFYEFIPMEELESRHPRALSIGEVETNKNYALVISTNAGLWRYMIGDTVMFTSLYPHKIVITGRTKHFINAFGEEIIVDNAERALKNACQKTGALISEYTAAPIFMGDNQKGTHEWIIEFEQAPDDPDYFITTLDNALISINSDYEAKRYKNITLGKPKLTMAPKGTFYKWLEKKDKLGGQNKVPRLYNNRKYVDELISIINS